MSWRRCSVLPDFCWLQFTKNGDAESKINDPTFILDCGYKGRVVLTGDQDDGLHMG